jgi:hypothetical protein
MYDTKTAKFPASWAEEVSQPADGTNGTGNGNADRHLRRHSLNPNNWATNVPASFLEGKAVRTVYGLVPLKFALDWPVFASYDELANCAAWMGGRIPTFEETRSIYSYVDYMRKAQAENKLGRTVPAVNG